MPIEQKYKTAQWEWIDVTAPTDEDLRFLHERYHINYLLLEDTIDPNHLPKFEEVGDVKFFLARESTDLERRTVNNISDISSKLGIFLLPKLIITTHRSKSKSIYEVCDELKKENLDDYKKFETFNLDLERRLNVELEQQKEHKKVIEQLKRYVVF